MRQLLRLFCMPYRRGNYCRFSGCATREEFWTFLAMHMILQALIYMSITGIAVYAGPDLVEGLLGGEPSTGFILVAAVVLAYVVFMLASIIPGLALTVRRYHDAGLSGLWLLAAVLVCLLGTVLVLAVLIMAAAQDFSPQFLESDLMGFLDLISPMDLVLTVFGMNAAALFNLLVLIMPGGGLGEKYRNRERERRLIAEKAMQPDQPAGF